MLRKGQKQVADIQHNAFLHHYALMCTSMTYGITFTYDCFKIDHMIASKLAII